MKTALVPAITMVALSCLTGTAAAKDDKRKDAKKSAAVEMTPAKPSQPKEPWVKVQAVITPHERDVIQTYAREKTKGKMFWNKSKSLPPGLAKKVARGGELPPGWQKKVCRGEVMPPEVFRQCQPLPPELVVQLPPPPPDTILVAVSGKVVRLINATREILDVFDVKY